jgi:hypothetical protein
MGLKVTVEFQLVEDEVLEAMETGAKTSRTFGILGFGAGVMGGAGLVLTGEWYLAGVLGAVVIGVQLLGRGINRSIIRTNARKYLRPTSARVSEDSFSIATAGSETEYKSRALMLWRESKRLLLVYPQPNLFYMVPKRAFTDEQLELFRARLRDWIGPEGVPKTA